MPKPHSSDEIIKTLTRNGFMCVAQKGSHMKFRKDGDQVLTVIVPANRKEIPHGTFRSIMRQSQLSEKDF
ncbi:MAG: hypothetical protein A3D67_00900 [Candidatus Lloydbacteria bacterium RIFCSPHIGHO2_02_FULL_51_22]|uniref:Addiction module toxin, HicA family n=3 Tax=Candidatus Lloydiibacteriota TaxID=1817910 RepID=A0A1G2D7U1_9BACT|nr:MAG: hypothetical protein A3D67_00900 [Candidatus Lloydbacteria bacterium RIFCSPHIGHO2_02_FULL_51_22]OGZ15053.1 MAG: hypothetical protein A3J08_01770 [Candidatus Lloydbacteria bacterium RIFCSPLOWO2_02_FULL_51_11]OGZ16935.1 MAG: hypothetical protein A3G11_00810 [Candidatus Lloydbacteria bacterium RIFCSPLOWO2_12_FULL_51_9]